MLLIAPAHTAQARPRAPHAYQSRNYFPFVLLYSCMEVPQAIPGLRRNWKQFALLVLINALVGGLLGLERSIFPRFASELFGLSSHTAMLSFIVAFGFSKGIANYLMGRLANRWGRHRLLIAGWVFALPVPLMLLFANQWAWVVVANLLLGISQGLAWSSTVVMKIDLAGAKNRGLAMGLNEFAGYLSIGVTAYFSASLAETYGLRPYPFYLGLFIAVVGLLLSLFAVRDTAAFVHHEQKTAITETVTKLFWDTTLHNPRTRLLIQAGLVNNLNDGMIWGLLPVFLAQTGLQPLQIGTIAALYPAVWGLGQIITGPMSDRWDARPLLLTGMTMQGLALLALPYLPTYHGLMLFSILMGIGTALVYPTFLSSMAAYSSPALRAERLGIFRLWRDWGYVIGALFSGLIADFLNIEAAFLLTGLLTLLSGLLLRKLPSTSLKQRF